MIRLSPFWFYLEYVEKYVCKVLIGFAVHTFQSSASELLCFIPVFRPIHLLLARLVDVEYLGRLGYLARSRIFARDKRRQEQQIGDQVIETHRE
jgi:hypothetical protein